MKDGLLSHGAQAGAALGRGRGSLGLLLLASLMGCRLLRTPRPSAAAGAVVVALGVMGGCGASINAIYEGNVRFERCMALDSRPDVKPTLRSACWEEWMKFYTYGQTRDRVEYAAMRQAQLKQTSNFDEGEWNLPPPRIAVAVPEPTNALAPPPMTFPVADAGPPPGPVELAPPALALPSAAPCSAECEARWSDCKKDCKTSACERACAESHQRCVQRCL